MSTATIGFYNKGITNGSGNRLPEGSEIPVLKPRTKRNHTDIDMVKLLDEALDNLSGACCCFWACQGPTKPANMITCQKCWAMRTIATVRATLAVRLKK